MLIDGFTVIAQIVNFLILVALLKHFLYLPIVKAMEQREMKIANRVREASLQLAEAEAQAALYQEKQQQLEQKKQTWLEQAQHQVKEEQQLLLQQARQEVETTKAQWYQNLEREKKNYFSTFFEQIKQQVMLITNHVLEDLAGSNLEEQIVNRFLQRLEEEQLVLAPQSEDKVVIKTAFDLTSEQQEKLIKAVHKYLLPQGKVQFKTAPELIGGIELTNQSCQIAWNIQKYLQQLTEVVRVSDHE